MAKIVTENFRVETTNELYRSFFNRNDEVVASFEGQLAAYNTENSFGLSNTNISDIGDIVSLEIDKIIPENNYYIFASALDGTTEIQNTQKDKREFQRRIIFGNKISEADVYYMFDRNPWIADVVYDSFDDTKDLTNLNMYVNVLDGDINEASYKVFKCIRNNNGAVSTIKPSTANIDSNFEVTLSDGYVWKYMFEVPASDYITYSTSQSLPYVPDNNVINAATENVSDIIIEQTRIGLFSAYDLGVTTVKSVSVEDAATNTYRIELDVANEPKSTDGSYINMYFRLSVSGEVFDIVNSTIPSNPEIDLADNRLLIIFVQSATNLVSSISAGASCSVVPKIQVSRSESAGENCVAYGSFDSAGTLNEILFQNKGTKYKYANAELLLSPAIQEYSAETTLRAIVSSRGGHGSDPISELRMSKLVVVTNFTSNDLTNTPATNNYTQVGLIKNPTFKDSTFPNTVDNRMAVVSSGNIEGGSILVNSYIYQDKANETVSGRIHEIVYDATANETTLYLVDYVGAFEAEFSAGLAYVKLNPTDEQSDNLTINTVTSGNYVPYSGDLLHFVNFDAITRSADRKEKVKFVFDF